MGEVNVFSTQCVVDSSYTMPNGQTYNRPHLSQHKCESKYVIVNIMDSIQACSFFCQKKTKKQIFCEFVGS